MREVVEEILRQYQPAALNVYIYGDATGEQRKTSASRTDWQIVRDFFGRYHDRFQAKLCVPAPIHPSRIGSTASMPCCGTMPVSIAC